MDDRDLHAILCRLEPGMTLTVPDEWVERALPGRPAERASRLGDILLAHGCMVRHGMGVQTFEKLDFPRTG